MKAVTTTTPEIKTPLTGTNLYLNILLLIGSLWGMTQDTAGLIVGSIMGLIATVGVVRSWLVSAKFTGLDAWRKDPNTWNYILAIVAALIPKASELVPALHDLSDAFGSGNWGKITTAAFSLLTMAYFIFFKK